MRAITVLLILIPLVVCYQVDTNSEESDYELTDTTTNLISRDALTNQNNDVRGQNELWNKIKCKSIEAWNHVKSVAKKVKNRISEWIQNVQKHAKTIQKTIEERLKKLGENIKKTIAKIKGTTQAVKECLKREQQEINNIIKETLRILAQCLANKTRTLTNLTENQSKITISDENTAFNNALEDKLAACEQSSESNEECLYKVRDEVHTDLEELENDIMETRSQSRSIADDILLALISCSLTSLIDSSTLITQEVAQIVNCVNEE